MHFTCQHVHSCLSLNKNIRSNVSWQQSIFIRMHRYIHVKTMLAKHFQKIQDRENGFRNVSLVNKLFDRNTIWYSLLFLQYRHTLSIDVFLLNIFVLSFILKARINASDKLHIYQIITLKWRNDQYIKCQLNNRTECSLFYLSCLLR